MEVLLIFATYLTFATHTYIHIAIVYERCKNKKAPSYVMCICIYVCVFIPSAFIRYEVFVFVNK